MYEKFIVSLQHFLLGLMLLKTIAFVLTITVTFVLIIYLPFVGAQTLPQSYYISVPYHHQIRGYYCGPAALEMIFDFYGPDVHQLEIGEVARTTPDGTFTFDMIRAAHFSNLSTSVGRALSGNITGYTARKLGYAAFEYWGMTMEELKSLIAEGYPIVVLTPWHYRVAVGYNSTYVTFQDSYWGEMLNMTYDDFLQQWTSQGSWGLFVSPWDVKVSIPRNVSPESVFNVTATITYPAPPPFSTTQYPASSSNATLTLPAGLSLVPGETATKTIGTGNLAAGESGTVSWMVKADSLGAYTVFVEAEGEVSGFVPPLESYPQYDYEDRIGGSGKGIIAVTSTLDETPASTVDDYDGSWRNRDFYINLTATDILSGVFETYYRINDGRVKTVSEDGQPLINVQGDNGKLEYWSEDWAGNEEEPHHVVTGIKLDKSPPWAEAGPDLTVAEDAWVFFNGSASGDNIGITDYVWDFTDTEPKTLRGDQPAYIFANPGVYTVSLKVTDAAGNYAVDSFKVTVRDVTPPKAEAGPDQTVNEDTLVTFDSSGSEDNVGIVRYSWTFMDQFIPQTLTGPNPTYTFEQPGTYIITLSVTDAAGKWTQDTVVITVLDVTKPVANAGQNQTVRMGEAVIFDASGSRDNVGIISCEWDFGDETTSTEITTEHTYSYPGTYTVTLTVRDAAGNVETRLITITVLFNETYLFLIAGAIAIVIGMAVVYRRAHRARAREQEKEVL